MVVLMSVEELFAQMQKMQVGHLIDIARDVEVEDFNGLKIGRRPETWYGIKRIDLGVFCDRGAFVLEYYGGGEADIVAYSEDPDDKDYALMDLKQYLKNKDLLQDGELVAVECTVECKPTYSPIFKDVRGRVIK